MEQLTKNINYLVILIIFNQPYLIIKKLLIFIPMAIFIEKFLVIFNRAEKFTKIQFTINVFVLTNCHLSWLHFLTSGTYHIFGTFYFFLNNRDKMTNWLKCLNHIFKSGRMVKPYTYKDAIKQNQANFLADHSSKILIF